jgi:uncharacterized protein YgiM (DUF1202 family)
MRVCLALGLLLLSAVRLLPAAAAIPIVEVATSQGDIRSGPGAAHEIMAEVRQGERYATLETRGEWYRIRSVDGREGRIHEKLVTVARSGEASQPRGPPRVLR